MSALTRDAKFSPRVWGETWVQGPGPLVTPRKPHPMAPGAPSSLQLLPPQRERESMSLGWGRPVPPGQVTQPQPANGGDPGPCGLETPVLGRAPEQVHATCPRSSRAWPFPPSAGQALLANLGKHTSPPSFLSHSAFPSPPHGSLQGRAHSRPDAGPS